MAQEQLNKGLEQVEIAIRNTIDSDVDILFDAAKHIILSGGKRIRPQVALLSYLAAGGTDVESAAPLASSVELVHTATLVHDDINDHSATRRGQVAVHAKWGRTFALLTGDYMFAKVYEMMSPYGTEINKIMSSACVTLVEGETLQAAAAKSGEMDRETYKKVIERKTASLFEAGAKMGATLASDDQALIDTLAIYGKYLGMAFQVVDDLLDLIGDPETMGKDAGLDVAQGRGMAVTLNGNGNGHHETAVMEAPKVDEDDPIERLMSKLREGNAAELVKVEAVRLSEKARDALQTVPASSARDMLEALIDKNLERQY